LWNAHPEIAAMLRRAIRTAAAAVAVNGAEVSLMLAGDSTARELNRRWRNQDRPTNVLSFPAHAGAAGRTRLCLLGDVVIAYETTRREAAAEQKPFEHHVAHLAVHGFLHLLGYDHAVAEDARAMEELETSILARLDVPDPYIQRDTIADE
jgi:probable rRNA maturation factor